MSAYEPSDKGYATVGVRSVELEALGVNLALARPRSDA